jgi:hypothetical protein
MVFSIRMSSLVHGRSFFVFFAIGRFISRIPSLAVVILVKSRTGSFLCRPALLGGGCWFACETALNKPLAARGRTIHSGQPLRINDVRGEPALPLIAPELARHSNMDWIGSGDRSAILHDLVDHERQFET